MFTKKQLILISKLKEKVTKIHQTYDKYGNKKLEYETINYFDEETVATYKMLLLC